jgi:hypothetical protein
MQTFLPFASFTASAEVLDYRRLGKQRVEALQIINVLRGRQKTNGWRNHPAVLMWAGYEPALEKYHDTMIIEWVQRGYNNSMNLIMPTEEIVMPWWYGNRDLHASHRSNLLRKDDEYYGRFGWSESPDLPYWWPSQQTH